MCHCRYSLELVTGARQLGPKWMEEEPALCLERKNCRWHTSKVSHLKFKLNSDVSQAAGPPTPTLTGLCCSSSSLVHACCLCCLGGRGWL